MNQQTLFSWIFAITVFILLVWKAVREDRYRNRRRRRSRRLLRDELADEREQQRRQRVYNVRIYHGSIDELQNDYNRVMNQNTEGDYLEIEFKVDPLPCVDETKILLIMIVRREAWVMVPPEEPGYGETVMKDFHKKFPLQ